MGFVLSDRWLFLLYGADTERTGSRRAAGVSDTPNTAALAPATRPAAAASSLAQRATAFVIEDMNQSQGSTADFLNYARKALDDRIDYYGKSTIRAEVLKDKERYLRVGLFEPIGF